MIAVLIIPLILEINTVLKLWLGNIYPKYSAEFAILVLLDMLICSLNTPFTQMAYATGKVKYYQISATIVHLCLFFFSWMGLQITGNPISVFIVSIIMSTINQLLCVIIIHHFFDFTYRDYIRNVILPCLTFFLLLPLLPYVVKNAIPGSLGRFFAVIMADVAMATILLYFVVINKEEKILLLSLMKKKKYVSH